MAGKTKKTPEEARRLARVIISDISLYNNERIDAAVIGDSLFEKLEKELQEGRKYYRSLVADELLRTGNHFNEAIVDVLIHPRAHLDAPIW